MSARQKQTVTLKPYRKNKEKFEVVKTTNVWDVIPGDLLDFAEMKSMVKNSYLTVNMVK
jgi:hypothetical protein